MVFGWLFGDKKRDEPRDAAEAQRRQSAEELRVRAVEATRAKDLAQGEKLSRELCGLNPDSVEGWNLLGVNLIRRDPTDPALRCEAVLAWMRALAVKPGHARAADHLRTELQYPDELIHPLAARLADAAPTGEDAADALAQIGARARKALDGLARAGGPTADPARKLLARLG